MEIKELHDKMSTAFEEFKKANDAALAEAKASGAASAETKAKVEKIEADIAGFETKLNRALRPGQGGDEGDKGPSLEVKAFDKFFRKGEQSLEPAERKALATDKGDEGGYGVPAPVRGAIIKKLIEFSPVRGLITIETISTGNAWEAPAEGATNFAAGKVGERDPRAETVAGKLRMERIPVHEFYAKPHVTQTMLDDSGFDVEGWSSERVGTRRSVLEGGYYINGTGEGEPEGMLTNADVAEVVSGSAALLTPDGIFDLIYALPETYARNASFMWKRSTTAAIRKFKDSQNQYLWNPGVNGGAAPTYANHGYTECIDMPAVGANTYPILFGDFKAAYRGVDRQDIRLLRDPFTSKPFIEMYFTWRQGGQVVLAEAIRKQKVST